MVINEIETPQIVSEILKNLLCINILHICYRYIIILNTKGSNFQYLYI